jgi:hypothetical protein
LTAHGFGARIFYTAVAGFDTLAGQAQPHARSLGESIDAVGEFF